MVIKKVLRLINILYCENCILLLSYYAIVAMKMMM